MSSEQARIGLLIATAESRGEAIVECAQRNAEFFQTLCDEIRRSSGEEQRLEAENERLEAENERLRERVNDLSEENASLRVSIGELERQEES